MHSQFLTYDEIESEVGDDELSEDSKANIDELYTTYADFFTLPILHPERFKSEVLAINPTIKGIAKAFDDLSQQEGKMQVDGEILGYLPSKDYREDNHADNINIHYIKSIIGGNYLTNGILGGIATGDTAALLNFFDIYSTHWKFIIYYEAQLKAAATSWYSNNAHSILKANRKYRHQCKKEAHILEKANAEGILCDDPGEKDRLLKYAREKLDEIDKAQSHRTYKIAIDDKLANILKMFKWGKELGKLHQALQVPSGQQSIQPPPQINTPTVVMNADNEYEEEVIASGSIEIAQISTFSQSQDKPAFFSKETSNKRKVFADGRQENCEPAKRRSHQSNP